MKWYQHFRILLPSWKFFESIGHEPLLFYRLGPQGTAWVHASFSPKKFSWGQLIIHPDGNLYWFYISTLQTLTLQILDSQGSQGIPIKSKTTKSANIIQTTASFQILKHWILNHVKGQRKNAPGFQAIKNNNTLVQMKISVKEPDSKDVHDLFTSDWYSLS